MSHTSRKQSDEEVERCQRWIAAIGIENVCVIVSNATLNAMAYWRGTDGKWLYDPIAATFVGMTVYVLDGLKDELTFMDKRAIASQARLVKPLV